jgi:hypothetical protein
VNVCASVLGGARENSPKSQDPFSWSARINAEDRLTVAGGFRRCARFRTNGGRAGFVVRGPIQRRPLSSCMAAAARIRSAWP